VAYVVTAKWTARPGQEDVVLEAIRRLIEPSRAEPGCRLYQPARDLDDPRVFVLIEVYDDEAAYRAHGDSEHFRRWAVDHAIPLLESRERTFLETVEP
jgi:quinol monooxygenase YgiN